MNLISCTKSIAPRLTCTIVPHFPLDEKKDKVIYQKINNICTG